jgi:hypothetical protein
MLTKAETLSRNLTGTYSIVGNYESCDHTGISDNVVNVLTDHIAIKVSAVIIQRDRDPQLCAGLYFSLTGRFKTGSYPLKIGIQGRERNLVLPG